MAFMALESRLLPLAMSRDCWEMVTLSLLPMDAFWTSSCSLSINLFLLKGVEGTYALTMNINNRLRPLEPQHLYLHSSQEVF